MIVGAITGAYAASYFLAAVQDTAAGNRDVSWPDDAFFSRFAQFLFLLWLFSCAAWPVGIVLMIEPALLGNLAIAIPLGLLPTALFPIFLLVVAGGAEPVGSAARAIAVAAGPPTQGRALCVLRLPGAGRGCARRSAISLSLHSSCC